MTGFEETHDAYLRCWNDALRSGDSSALEDYLADGYHGWFATDATEVHPYDRRAAVDGMRQSVARLQGARMRAQRRVTTRRGEGEAVVFYRKRVDRDGEPAVNAVIVETWSTRGGGWLLERELTEHGTSVGESA